MPVSGRFIFDFLTPSPSNPTEFIFPPLAPAIHAVQAIIVAKSGIAFGDPRVPTFIADEHERQLAQYLADVGFFFGRGQTALKTVIVGGLGIPDASEFKPANSGPNKLLVQPDTPAKAPPANSGSNKLLVQPDTPAKAPPANSGPNKLLVQPDDKTPGNSRTTSNPSPIVDMPDMGHMDDPPPKR